MTLEWSHSYEFKSLNVKNGERMSERETEKGSDKDIKTTVRLREKENDDTMLNIEYEGHFLQKKKIRFLN